MARKVHKMTAKRRSALRKAQMASARKRRRRNGVIIAAAGIGTGVAISATGYAAARSYARHLSKAPKPGGGHRINGMLALPAGKSRPPTAKQANRKAQRAAKIAAARAGVTPHTVGTGVWKVSPNGKTRRITRHRPGYDARRRSEYVRRPRPKRYKPRSR